MTKENRRLALSRFEGWIDPMTDDNGRGPRGFRPGSNMGILGYPDGPRSETLQDYTQMNNVDRVVNSLNKNQRLEFIGQMFLRCGSLDNIVKSGTDEVTEALLKSLNLWEY